MEKARREHVIGIPVSNRAFGIEEPDFPSKVKGGAYHGGARNPAATAGRAGKFGRNGDRVAQGLKEHGEFDLQPILDLDGFLSSFAIFFLFIDSALNVFLPDLQ